MDSRNSPVRRSGKQESSAILLYNRRRFGRPGWRGFLRVLPVPPPEVYRRIFEPGGRPGSGPSGLADWPRPFVFRTAHLDGAIVQPGEPFFFDVHVFDLEQPMLPYFQSAFAQLAAACATGSVPCARSTGEGRSKLTSQDWGRAPPKSRSDGVT